MGKWPGQAPRALLATLFAISIIVYTAYFIRTASTIRSTYVSPQIEHVLAANETSNLILPSPILVFIFLTTQGLTTAKIWEAWYQDAERYLSAKGHHASDFIGGVVHYHPNFTVSDVHVPTWLETKIDPLPVSSKWGYLLPAMQRALSFAYATHLNGTYFIFLSDSSVPLKSFDSLWAAIYADPRTRADLYCPDHFGGNPKHSQWIMLSRAHAVFLATHTEWAFPRVNWVKGRCVGGLAASDEYWPIKTLMREPMLNSTSQDFWFKGGTGSSIDCLQSWTFIYWREFNSHTFNQRIGESVKKRGHPAGFDALQSSFLRRMVQTQGSWFLRKVSDEATVRNCFMDLVDYYSLVLGGDLRHNRREAEDEPTRDCKLHEFLPALWSNHREGQTVIQPLEKKLPHLL